MNNIFTDHIKIALRWLILVVLVIACGAISYVYYLKDYDPRTMAILGGLAAGFVGIIIQYVMDWSTFRVIDRFRALKIREVLTARKDKDYYQHLLSKAKREIKILGVTAQRFLADFADENSNDKVLLDRLNLNQNLQVRILVADKAHLDTNNDKSKHDIAKTSLDKLSQQFGTRFAYKYYTHTPTHSIVLVDDEAIVGPVFSGIESKHTPAIHISVKSELAQKYLHYFDTEWNKY